jgi:hypothetical protein
MTWPPVIADFFACAGNVTVGPRPQIRCVCDRGAEARVVHTMQVLYRHTQEQHTARMHVEIHKAEASYRSQAWMAR